MTSIKDTATLNDGNKMPLFGLGVFLVEDGNDTINSIKYAIDAGYKLIDTASIYGNEKGVGRAIKESGIDRKDIFITTKCWNADQGYDQPIVAMDKSLELLQMDYVDLYLIHWPGQNEERMINTWKALIELKKQGKAKSIGVSNFTIEQIEAIINATGVSPAVNQVECHLWLQQKELLNYCKKNNILLQAWGPMMQGHSSEEKITEEIAPKYSKSKAQIMLRWNLDRGVAIIPKSIKQNRIIENADIFDFELSPEDAKKLNDITIEKRFGPHPLDFDMAFKD